MPHVYMLRCSDGSFYVGSTRDLERRLAQHRCGLGAEYTKRRLPVELVWESEFERVEDAFRWEKQIQGWSRAKRQRLIDHGIEGVRGWSRECRQKPAAGE